MSENEWKQWEDLPLEKEEELIEKLAKYLIKHKLDTIALMTLESGGPLTSLFAEFWMGIYGPYLDFFEVDEYMALLRKKKNIKKLIAKLEESQGKKGSSQHSHT
jgi:hypothetical protein